MATLEGFWIEPMDEFTCAVDGQYVIFFTSIYHKGGGVEWAWLPMTSLNICANTAADKILRLLNHDPPIPAVQMWLSSGQYGGMTLEEFLGAVNG